MKSETGWRVMSVYGHELEKLLQQLSDDGYEIVSIDRSRERWTVIAHTTDRQTTKGNAIGFRPPGK